MKKFSLIILIFFSFFVSTAYGYNEANKTKPNNNITSEADDGTTKDGEESTEEPKDAGWHGSFDANLLYSWNTGDFSTNKSLPKVGLNPKGEKFNIIDLNKKNKLVGLGSEVYLTFEHPIPVLPNVKFQYTGLRTSINGKASVFDPARKNINSLSFPKNAKTPEININNQKVKLNIDKLKIKDINVIKSIKSIDDYNKLKEIKALEGLEELVDGVKNIKDLKDVNIKDVSLKNFDNIQVFPMTYSAEGYMDYSHIDATFYYRLVPARIPFQFDLGLSVRYFIHSLNSLIPQNEFLNLGTSSSGFNQELKVLPLIYADISVNIPNTGISMGFGGNFIVLSKEIYLNDWKLAFKYTMEFVPYVHPGIEIGYRYFGIHAEIIAKDKTFYGVDLHNNQFYAGIYLAF